jgi:transposase-like protein
VWIARWSRRGAEFDGGEREKAEVPPRYTEGFKKQMIQKMLGPPGRSASSLAEEIGSPHKSTLSKWLRDAGSIGGMGKKKNREGKSIREWTAPEKMEVLLQAASLSEEELGGFFRERGIYEAQLRQWRAEALDGLSMGKGNNDVSAQLSAERKKVKELERELRRKEKALAEAAALLVLQKKIQARWGDGEDGTSGKNG